MLRYQILIYTHALFVVVGDQLTILDRLTLIVPAFDHLPVDVPAAFPQYFLLDVVVVLLACSVPWLLLDYAHFLKLYN